MRVLTSPSLQTAVRQRRILWFFSLRCFGHAASNENYRQFVVYFRLHKGKFTGKHAKMASFSLEHEAPAESRPGLGLHAYLVFRRFVNVLTTGSITFSTSQPCCFFFVFLRFIFPPILLCWNGAVPPCFFPLFCLFHSESEGCGNCEIGGTCAVA